MKELNVLKEEELYTFLRENLSGSKNNIKSMLTHELVSVNDKIITKYNYLLKAGDKVSIGAKKVNSFLGNIKIIYEDNDFLVVNKPSGMLTIATEEEKYSNNNLFYVLSNYVKKKNSNAKIYVVHRLDKDTSGVLLFSKNKILQEKLQDNWNEITERIYYAVVIGITKEKDTITSYLKEDKNLMTSIGNPSNGKIAITEYVREKHNDKYSLLRINIKTGRRNQIRVQLKSVGYPILGDSKYGKKDKTIKRMMLHAEKLSIINPVNNKKMIFEAKREKYFDDLLSN